MFDTIGYTGKVTIKIKNKPPIRKFNSGTSTLFKALCNFLINGSSDNIPYQIQLISGIDAETLATSTKLDSPPVKYLTISPLPLISRLLTSTDSAYFSTVLWHSQVMHSDQSLNQDTDCFVVMQSSNGHVLAFSPFKFSEIQPVWEDSNSQCVIEWEMTFSNEKKGTES